MSAITMGSNNKRMKSAFMPARPHEKVEASSLLKFQAEILKLILNYSLSNTYRYNIIQTFNSPGFPYANGTLPLPIALSGASDMGVSRENRSTSASICWLDSKKRSRLLRS